ncbi:unnamed protein product, partial [marine sediment metagenome]
PAPRKKTLARQPNQQITADQLLERFTFPCSVRALHRTLASSADTGLGRHRLTSIALGDVWDGGVKSPDTIRSAIRNLRQRLSDAATARFPQP